jgi:hypothetical protein
MNPIENISAISVGEPLFNVNCETWEMSGGEASFNFNLSTSESMPTTESRVSHVVPMNNDANVDNELNVTNESIAALEAYFDMYEELIASKTDSVQSDRTCERVCDEVASPSSNNVTHHTRSRGSVRTLPNVQKLILERSLQKKKKKNLKRLQSCK